ncbi:ATP-binding protein [Maribacter sp. 2304DJ31-5]|uniref:tetratricopeptide repeat-containing sensor histidine kinase n=1 Tax=Maribacter sp. 2304DJ31-5 TaxID=3386273 RepID=UPI0039BCDCDF
MFAEKVHFQKKSRKQVLKFGTLIIGLFFSLISFCQSNSRDSILRNIQFQKQKPEFKETDTIYINSLTNLVKEYRYYKLDSLRLLADKIMEISEVSHYAYGKAKAHLALGRFHSDKGDHKLAIENYKSAALIAKQINNSTVLLNTIDGLAIEYGYKGDYSMALREYFMGAELAIKYDNKNMQSIINENIANLYLSQKDYDQAMIFFEKVKKINKEIGNPIYMAETMSNMAAAYADMGKLDYAMFNINSSINTFEKKKIMDWLAYAYEIKGKVYLKQKKYRWAMHWYKQSELLHKNLEDERAEVPLLNGMANASLHLQNDSIAETYALKALELSKKIGSMDGTLECSKTLYSINKKKGDFKTALHYHEIFQNLSDSLITKENQKGLTMLKTKLKYDEQKKQLILKNEKALAKQKNYVYVAFIILFIFLGITLLIRRNERIQKTLNKELISKKNDLEKNEEYLRDVNQTKNKLFSIIGHDLRGPIGAFQGLLKLFKDGEMSNKEFLAFVPKLRTDIDHIAFTLNNLLSWGQTQMNGATTKPCVTALENIVEDNIALLSEIAHNKSIKFINRIEANTHIWSDANQIDIVIRNLVSNALKFTPENGMITIGATEKTRHWEIYIRDNGIGMNEETMGKIFKKENNHSSYGTNDEKGTGLGLSLCKEMVEKNKGVIWVNSAPNKGSSFYFTIPKAKKEYKKTA